MKRFRIFPKILVSCLLVAIIPLFGLIYQIDLSGEDQKKVVEQGLLQFSEMIESEVNHWVDKNLRSSRFLADLESFKNMDAESQVPLLKSAKNNLEWVSLIFVANTNGDAVARSDGKPLRNYSDRDYFKQVMSGESIGQQVLIGKLKPVPLHCFAIPVESRSNKIAGVLTQCSTLVAISDYVANARLGRTGYSFLLDDKNRLIAYGGESGRLLGQLQNFSDHPGLTLKDNVVANLQHNGSEKVFISRPVGPGWKLIVQQDYNEAYEHYLEAKFNALVLAALTVIVTILLSLWVSHSISSPVKQLTIIANAYSKGVFIENFVDQGRGVELDELARSISRMKKTMQIAINRLKKIKKASV